MCYHVICVVQIKHIFKRNFVVHKFFLFHWKNIFKMFEKLIYL